MHIGIAGSAVNALGEIFHLPDRVAGNLTARTPDVVVSLFDGRSAHREYPCTANRDQRTRESERLPGCPPFSRTSRLARCATCKNLTHSGQARAARPPLAPAKPRTPRRSPVRLPPNPSPAPAGTVSLSSWPFVCERMAVVRAAVSWAEVRRAAEAGHHGSNSNSRALATDEPWVKPAVTKGE